MDACQKVERTCIEQPLFSLLPLVQPSNLSEKFIPNSEMPLEEEEPQNKRLVCNRRKQRSRRKGTVTVGFKTNIDSSVDIKLEKDLIKETHSKKVVHTVGRQQQHAASRVTLQNKLVSHVKKERDNSSWEVESHGKDMASNNNRIHSLLETELKIQSCREKKSLRKKYRRVLVKSELHGEIQNLTEKEGSFVVGLDSQKVIGSLKKDTCCSSSGPQPLLKTWFLRERTKSVRPEQKTFRNPNQRLGTERKCLSSKSEPSIQSLSLQKCKRQRKRGISCCKSQNWTPENCTENPVEVRSSSVPHLPSVNVMERTGSLVKRPNMIMMQLQETEQALGKRCRNSSTAAILAKSQDVVTQKQKNRQLLGCVVDQEDSKKCRNAAEEGKHRIVTRAFLKSMLYGNDSKKLCSRLEKSVPMQNPGSRQRRLKKPVTIRQMVECAPTEDPLITGIEGSSKRETDGNEEIVTSAELKIKIKAPRKENPEIVSIHDEILSKSDLSTSQDCSLQNLPESSESLPVSKSDEAENKDPLSSCFGKEAAVCCDSTSFPLTNAKHLHILDIKVTENKVEKNTLVVHHDEKARFLAKNNILPCKEGKNPIVRLLDCRYIKALVKHTGDTIQSYKVHREFLHVALAQRKVLSSSGGMGQNDLNSSPNVVPAGTSFTQKNKPVEKAMCQNRKNNSRCQNGNKRLGESEWCVDFKKPRKRIKMFEDPEKAAEEDLTNMTIYREYGLQIGDRTTTADSSVVEEKLNYSETTSSLNDHTPVFFLEQVAQNPLADLSGSKKVSYKVSNPDNSFEKSDLKRRKDALVSKGMEPQFDCITKTNDDDNSIVETVTCEKISSFNSDIGDSVKRKMRAPILEKKNKARRKSQLFSCQRVVPISGKNNWPCESCARTSVWVCKNHGSDSERGLVKGTDSVVNSGQVELHKPFAGTNNASVNMVTNCKTELADKTPTSEYLPDTCKSIGNKDRLSSTDTEKSKQCTTLGTKKVKRSKIALHSPMKDVKNRGGVMEQNISMGTQNCAFVDKDKRDTNYQKTSLAKQEVLLKTLNTKYLSNFKIPLLKDKSDPRQTPGRSLENICTTVDILEDVAASVNKVRAKETSSDVNSGHWFYSEQVNGITVPVVEKHTDKFGSGSSECLSKERSLYNENVGASHESELESSTLKESPDFLNSGHIERQMMGSIVASKIKDYNFSNNSAQLKNNLHADILKAYEDDVLVIDVIQDDPDLFGNSEEREAASTKAYSTENNFNSSVISKNTLKLEPVSPQLSRSRHLKFCPGASGVQDSGTLKSVTDDYVSLLEADEIKSDSLSGASPTRGVTESSFEDQLAELDDFMKSSVTNKKYKCSDKMIGVKKEAADIQEIAKTENVQYTETVSYAHTLELPFPTTKAVAPQRQGTAVNPWMMNALDFRYPQKGPFLPSAYPNSNEPWKGDRKPLTNLGLTGLPHGYCRIHFNTLNGCMRKNCWYSHVPESGNEKIFSEILKKYISIGEMVLLQRAVQIFTDYCKEATPGMLLDSQMVNDLVTSLLQYCLLKEIFQVFHTSMMIKILPAVDLFLKVFEHVASMKLREAVPELIDISCKLVDAGMVLEHEHFSYITKFLNQLQVCSQEIALFMSRFEARPSHKMSICDFDSARAEFQHCKEKGDWAKLGTLYINVRGGCEKFGDIEKCSLCIADILTNSVKEERPGIPFCKFAAAVSSDSHHNEADMTLLGRIGISVMFSYYRLQQWSKAKKVLDTFRVLRIPFTFLKGLSGQERWAPRCQIVNIAVEILLKSGKVDGAIWILRESEWVINAPSWPCDRMDVLKRHNLLCTIASEYITKSHYKEAFEVLQNLPGFQNSLDAPDVAQYSLLFNKLLGACSESKNLGMSSAVIEFMFAKNIPIDFKLLRALITALGRSCLWVKARTYYKSALALGCYPPLEGNIYRKLVLIPSYMTEIEMLLAIEIFLVSNASSIQGPGASSQILQIVLKRCEGSDDYHSAVDRLIQAARLSSPKLFIKYLTVNANMEQVYTLDYTCALKWLKENMKWAGKAWLFQ